MTKFADSKESPQIHLKLGDEIRKSVGGIGSFKNFSYLCEKIKAYVRESRYTMGTAIEQLR